jgi:hypothetical protein
MKEAVEIIKRWWGNVVSIYEYIAQDKIEFYQTSKNGSSYKKYSTGLTDLTVFILRIFSFHVHAEEYENLSSYAS